MTDEIHRAGAFEFASAVVTAAPFAGDVGRDFVRTSPADGSSTSRDGGDGDGDGELL